MVEKLHETKNEKGLIRRGLGFWCWWFCRALPMIFGPPAVCFALIWPWEDSKSNSEWVEKNFMFISVSGGSDAAVVGVGVLWWLVILLQQGLYG